MSGDLIERLIADIIEVTETLLSTSISASSQDIINTLKPSNPTPVLENITQKAAALTSSPDSYFSMRKKATLSFFEATGTLDPLGLFVGSLSFLIRLVVVIALWVSKGFMDKSIGIPASNIDVLAAASSGNMSVHQPDHTHGRPESSNFEIFGEEKGQSTFAKQC